MATKQGASSQRVARLKGPACPLTQEDPVLITPLQGIPPCRGTLCYQRLEMMTNRRWSKVFMSSVFAAVSCSLIWACSVQTIETSASDDTAAEQKKISTLMHNMAEIAGALNAFKSRHGAYPPIALTNKNGEKVLSWRVALLKFLNEDSLYKEFDCEQRWDAPCNKKLLAKMPQVFAHPRQGMEDVSRGLTHIWPTQADTRAFTGTPRTAQEFLRQPVLIVEAPKSIEWTKTDGFVDVELMVPNQLSLMRPGGYYAAYHDESVAFVLP
jgi:hypothetical protein